MLNILIFNALNALFSIFFYYFKLLNKVFKNPLAFSNYTKSTLLDAKYFSKSPCQKKLLSKLIVLAAKFQTNHLTW